MRSEFLNTNCDNFGLDLSIQCTGTYLKPNPSHDTVLLKGQSHEIDHAGFNLMNRSQPNSEPLMVFEFFHLANYYIFN